MSTKVMITAAVLCGLVLLQYAVTCSFGFLPYDDTIHITENRLFAVQESTDLIRAWLSPVQKLYIPLTYTVWAGIARIARHGISGDGYWLYQATLFHAVNVLLHLWNTLWVAAILRVFIRREFAVAVAAAVFALHPLQIEVVAWVSGMRDLLSAGLALPALWCVAVALSRQQNARTYVILATGLYILALLAKPGAVALPLMCGVLVLYLRPKVWRWWLVVAVWSVLALPLVVVTKTAQTTPDFVTYPWWQRPWVAVDAISFYLAKVLVPVSLSLDYGLSPNVVVHGLSRWCALGVVCLLSLWVSLRWKSLWVMGVAMLVAALVPVLGLVAFEFQFHSTVADRYIYLGMLGVALVLAHRLAEPHKLIDGIGTMVLVIAVVVAWPRVRLWGESRRLFEQTLATNPGSVLAWQALGAEHMAQQRWYDAMISYRSILAVRPDFLDAEYNLGVALEHLERHDEALAHFLKIAQSSQASYASLTGVARCAKRLQRWDVAVDAIERAERQFPGRFETLWIWAELLVANQDLPGAEEKFRLALARRPGAYDLRTIYADFLAERGDQMAAIAQYQLVLDGEPRAVAARINLGGVLARMGRYDEAEKQLREGVRLAPDLATARVNLGVLLENTGRAVEAVREFEAALRLEPGRADARVGLERLMQKGVSHRVRP